jgi:Protein of unknown function (DUF1579)
MMAQRDETSFPLARPDPALKRLDRLVGIWEIRGRTLGSPEDNITGRMTCEWLPGGFFLKQTSEIGIQGFRVESLEIIGYDPACGNFPSTVYSSMSGSPLPYHWDVQGDEVTHWTPTNKYTGLFSKDGKVLSGGWRPLDGTPGMAYDAVMTRVE